MPNQCEMSKQAGRQFRGNPRHNESGSQRRGDRQHSEKGGDRQDHHGHRPSHNRSDFIPKEELYPYKEYDIKEGAYREVVICQISNPNNFFVRITENEEDYRKLKIEMSDKLRENKFPPAARLVRGMPVVVTNRFGKTVSRGLVQDQSSHRVELVDTGRHTSFHIRNLMRIEPDSPYLKIPKFAIKCALTEDEPYTEKSLKRFREDFVDCRFLAHFKKKMEKHRYLVNLLHFEQISSFDTLKIFIDKPVDSYPVADLQPDTIHEIIIIKKFSERSAYVALFADRDKWDRVRKEFEDYYERLEDDVYHYKEDQLVAGLPIACCVNGRWRRASVLELKDDNVLSVFLVDLGETVQIGSRRAKKLLDSYAEVPPLAIRCSTASDRCFPKDVGRRIFCRFLAKDESGYQIDFDAKEKHQVPQVVPLPRKVLDIDPVIIEILERLIQATEIAVSAPPPLIT